MDYSPILCLKLLLSRTRRHHGRAYLSQYQAPSCVEKVRMMSSRKTAHVLKTDYDFALIAASRKLPDLAQAAKLLESANEKGDRRATYALATWYLYGHASYAKNPRKAVQLLKLAAAADVGAAHFDLAVCYETGEGVRKNDTKAYLHYLAAALNGDLNAIGEVGRCLFHAIGISRDRKAAEVWFRLADVMDVEIR